MNYYRPITMRGEGCLINSWMRDGEMSKLGELVILHIYIIKTIGFVYISNFGMIKKYQIIYL